MASISPDVGNLLGLRRLHLANMELEVLPESLSECTELEVIAAQHNRIERLPTDIGNLTSLKVSAELLLRPTLAPTPRLAPHCWVTAGLCSLINT